MDAMAGHRLLDLVLRNQRPVRSGRYQQGGIVGRDRVEMDPQCQHSGEQGEGWRHVLHAMLDGPGAKAGHVAAGGHGDRAILVPAQRPIGAVALVEQDGADGLGMDAYAISRDLSDDTFCGEQGIQTGDPVQA
ncbi:hypothetical protein J2W22_000343 [Sphingomonas kyeonggiensis]|nr:hypothetical protein [Sphingomonas kyeonggiensis]